MSFLCPEAKLFKIEKFLLNYACFKHPWVLKVMSMSVDINNKIVLWLWSPGNFFCILEQLFSRIRFFPEYHQWELPRIAWTLIRQNVVEKLIPDPLTKIKIEHLFRSTAWNAIKFVFIVQVEFFQNALVQNKCCPLSFTLNKAF